jgi:Uma2 family endonuclease
MSRAPIRKVFTVSEYLSRETSALEKHEYRDGEIISMAGGTADNSLISANLIRELGNHLKGKPCRVYDSNLRVKISRSVLLHLPGRDRHLRRARTRSE